ncbi:MAG: hypothetical protein ACRDUX_12625 [Mycobacterium sp.]|jgi:hypothetical protein
MSTLSAWSLVAFASGTAVVAAVIGVAASGETSLKSGPGTQMQTGVTVTQSVAPDAPIIEQAAPSITGPAPLPVEEQGLPG